MKKIAILFVLLLVINFYSSLKIKSEFEDWSFQNYYYNVPDYEVTFTKDMDLLPLEIENKSYNPIDLAPEYISPTLKENKKIHFDIKDGFKLAKIDKEKSVMHKVGVYNPDSDSSKSVTNHEEKSNKESNSLFDHMYDEENERIIYLIIS